MPLAPLGEGGTIRGVSFRIILIVGIFATTSGCGQGLLSLASLNSGSSLQAGTLETRVQKTYQAQRDLINQGLLRNLESCDVQEMDQRVLITRALDARAKDIQAYLIAHPVVNDNIRQVMHGPLMVTEQIKLPTITPGWKSFDFGWSDAVQLYEQIKDQPVNQDWITLSGKVGSVLGNDEHRMVYHFHSDVNYDTVATFQTIVQKIQACQSEADCKQFGFTTEEQTLFDVSQTYSIYAEKLQQTSNESDRVQVISDLLNWINSKDLYYYTPMNPNANVKRLDATTFEVTLRGGDLVAIEPDLQNFIEAVWNRSSQHKIKIVWDDSSQNPNIDRYVLNPLYGVSSYVNWADHVISLAQGVYDGGIAHEFGHVLGLPDNYYVTWNSSSCKYSQFSDQTDVMSYANTGAVTDAQWQVLESTYK